MTARAWPEMNDEARQIWNANAAFSAGLVLDGLEEPAFPPGAEPGRRFGWQAYPEIPPVLAARLRRPWGRFNEP